MTAPSIPPMWAGRVGPFTAVRRHVPQPGDRMWGALLATPPHETHPTPMLSIYLGRTRVFLAYSRGRGR